jgi:hypothetical protein
MRSGSLRPFVPVALRWVSFRGFGAGSAPIPNLAKPRGRINRLRHRYVCAARVRCQVKPVGNFLGIRRVIPA